MHYTGECKKTTTRARILLYPEERLQGNYSVWIIII